MRRYRYWECCVGLPGGLVRYISDSDRSGQVSYDTFARHVDLGPMRAEGHPATYRMSCRDNWAISYWRSRLPSGQPVYYFDWSRIEHVFVAEPVDLARELELLEEAA